MARMLRTDRGLDRLVNFSDATVAIAITLLLLPLVDVADDIEHESLGKLLGENVGTIIAFFVSFVVISRLWLSHHRLFEATQSYSNIVLRVNFVWLASIAFLPFSSNLIAQTTHDRGVNALYIGTIAMASLSMTVMQWTVWRDPALIREDGRAMLHPVDGTVTFIALVVALVGAVLVPGGGAYWLLLLVPAGWLSNWLERRLHDR
ncbi:MULTISPECIES: TMEM175 family protein [unclassified Curtobacterium]|uniref:TMEM175 family protein n=1 Tax=unclassified Curtobacterium TaxID=257496 RepID=UPI000F4B03F0|nr:MULTISPECIES: TMEM175 family protein [unclassified Curtobacterium]ROP63426.1 putative membrane protein [Curtobacterium sp. ZW137]TCK66101.1 putative membrane protein [Curtobacterium sp. PhB136]